MIFEEQRTHSVWVSVSGWFHSMLWSLKPSKLVCVHRVCLGWVGFEWKEMGGGKIIVRSVPRSSGEGDVFHFMTKQHRDDHNMDCNIRVAFCHFNVFNKDDVISYLLLNSVK